MTRPKKDSEFSHCKIDRKISEKEDLGMKKTHILVVLAFDDDSSDAVNIGIELSIQHDITQLLQKYHHDKLISHYVVADNEVISEKLKSDDTVKFKELLKLADFHSIKLPTNEGESKYLPLEELEKIIFEMQEGEFEECTEKELISEKNQGDKKEKIYDLRNNLCIKRSL